MADGDVNGKGTISKSGLTEAEQDVMGNLVLAWNKFVRLPVQHPTDQEEFMRALHECQRLLMARIVRREHPGCWRNEEGKLLGFNYRVATQVKGENTADVEGCPLEVVRDLLLLIAMEIPETVIASWTRQQQQEVITWANAVELAANDYPVKVPGKPAVLTAYEFMR